MTDATVAWPELLRRILRRDVEAFARVIADYPDEAQLWAAPAGVANSTGTLALHLAGNLRHFIGLLLGGVPYVRDRPSEFARRGVPRAELLEGLGAAVAAIDCALPQVTDARLATTFPEAVGGVQVSVAEMLVHLVSHTAYHLGQADYHRRLVTGRSETIGAVRLTEIVTPAAERP